MQYNYYGMNINFPEGTTEEEAQEWVASNKMVADAELAKFNNKNDVVVDKVDTLLGDITNVTGNVQSDIPSGYLGEEKSKEQLDKEMADRKKVLNKLPEGANVLATAAANTYNTIAGNTPARYAGGFQYTLDDKGELIENKEAKESPLLVNKDTLNDIKPKTEVGGVLSEVAPFFLPGGAKSGRGIPSHTGNRFVGPNKPTAPSTTASGNTSKTSTVLARNAAQSTTGVAVNNDTSTHEGRVNAVKELATDTVLGGLTDKALGKVSSIIAPGSKTRVENIKADKLKDEAISQVNAKYTKEIEDIDYFQFKAKQAEDEGIKSFKKSKSVSEDDIKDIGHLNKKYNLDLKDNDSPKIVREKLDSAKQKLSNELEKGRADNPSLGLTSLNKAQGSGKGRASVNYSNLGTEQKKLLEIPTGKYGALEDFFSNNNPIVKGYNKKNNEILMNNVKSSSLKPLDELSEGLSSKGYHQEAREVNKARESILSGKPVKVSDEVLDRIDSDLNRGLFDKELPSFRSARDEYNSALSATSKAKSEERFKLMDLAPAAIPAVVGGYFADSAGTGGALGLLASGVLSSRRGLRNRSINNDFRRAEGDVLRRDKSRSLVSDTIDNNIKPLASTYARAPTNLDEPIQLDDSVDVNTQSLDTPIQLDFDVNLDEPIQLDDSVDVDVSETITDTTKATNVSEEASVVAEAIVKAETGGMKDPFVFTGGKDLNATDHSSAYGPGQITRNLAKDYLDRKADLFTPEQLEYLELMVEQGSIMLNNARNGVKGTDLSYGGKGVLGETAKDRQLYKEVMGVMIEDKLRENNGNLSKTLQSWRGVDSGKDPRWYNVVYSELDKSL